ncbi:UDP-N-acetylglucosamine--dolichyl-phosphate N-acetylglucosaminephosphotransferase [Toxocara canis]|uniref:UDP-N-acetylglucosamine--dolichyl-phosphate N-acetylglucosaminephosphotransferase n=1 Tax=Toxocara canis TaxID=6265 RepID=A0A0B2VJD4_TOXCA|nr:UDP-N-acetylglucosamine--dolichyl-phosphate N-acetylglucosaminephosphotransferase [Toxocara canis]
MIEAADNAPLIGGHPWCSAQNFICPTPQMAALSLFASVLLSCMGAFISYHTILEYLPIFIHRKMYGKDQCKASNIPIPEPAGVISAAVYLIVMFVFIPFPFYEWMQTEATFPHDKLLAFLSALIGICSAILLGFADDVLDLRWRHKLLFPTLSTLPLLLVYYATGSSTSVVVPKQVRALLPFDATLDIGPLYYIYMGMMVVFCTNAINILAGINGLEAGQALVIAVSVAVFDIVQLMRLESQTWYHCLSLYILLPFIATTAVLLYFNWYPASVFVGDTFCYWAGMTLASTCILGHFSKTMALFLLPQVFNFLYSIPQLFHLVPCPRHRLPKFDVKTDTVGMSFAEFKDKDLKPLGAIVLRLFDIFGLLHRRVFEKDGESWTEINNLTLINLVLKIRGPMHERSLTKRLLSIQIFCSLFAFFIRFYLAFLVYDVVN